MVIKEEFKLDNSIIYKVSWCPVCDQGWVEIVKDKNSGQLFVCCNECETEWEKPEDIHDTKLGTIGKHGMIVKPLLEEIESIKWDKYIDKS